MQVRERKVNRYKNSIKIADDKAIQDCLDDFYQSFFPTSYCQRITGNGILEGEQQKAGIDVIIHCQNIGKTFYIDEKIRDEDYNDILLEEYSNWQLKTPGWLEKNNRSDFIAYTIKPSHLIYMLPYPILRLAYLSNKSIWIEANRRNGYKNGRVFAQNEGYETSSIPVSWPVLKSAMNNIMRQQYKLGLNPCKP